MIARARRVGHATAWAAVAVAIGACAGNGAADGKQTRVPTAPPRTLETLSNANPEPQAKAFPPVTAPIRYGPCGVPLAVAPEGLATRAGIQSLQQRLVAEGTLSEGEYAPGELDEPTLAAVLSFQREVGLPAVGVPTYATAEALELEPSQIFRNGDASCAPSSDRRGEQREEGS